MGKRKGKKNQPEESKPESQDTRPGQQSSTGGQGDRPVQRQEAGQSGDSSQQQSSSQKKGGPKQSGDQGKGKERGGPPQQETGLPQQPPQQAWGQQRGPSHQRQGQQRGPPQQQQQGQQRGPPQQGQQRGPFQQQQQGQKRDPPQQQQQGQQRGPPQQQFAPPQWQGQQRGPPQQQFASPQQQGQQRGPPQQQFVPQHQTQYGYPPQQQFAPPQQQGGPPQQQQKQQRSPPEQQVGPPQQEQGVTQEPAGRGTPQKKRGQQKQPQLGSQQQQQRGASRDAPRQEKSASSEGITAAMSQLKLTGKDQGDENLVSKSKIKPGTVGRRIKVESNHLQLDLMKLSVAYHYDVAINPETPKKFMRPAMEEFRRKFFPNRHPAFDGKKNLYTPTPLNPDINMIFEGEVMVDDGGKGKKFKVEVKFANKVDMTPLKHCFENAVTPREALQVVDIVLRMAPVTKCIPVGRSFFIKPDRILDLGEGMEMYSGFYQSAIRGWKPLLNVDVAHKAFPKNIPALDAILEVISDHRTKATPQNLESMQAWQQETANKFIKSLRVQYEIPNHPGSRKCYRVNGLGSSARKSTFVHNNQSMTIEEYFVNVKHCRLRYPLIPTLHVGDAQRKDKILLPLELCTVMAGQPLNRKMTENQTRAMIRYSATSTDVRKDKIRRGIATAGYNQNPSVREFGITVGDEFQKLDARILPPPPLKYSSGVVNVSKGVWRNSTFIQAATIVRWTIASAVSRYGPRPDEYKRMEDMLMKSGKEAGMMFNGRATEPFISIGGRQNYNDILKYFNDQAGKYDIIFVVVPDSGPQYSYVKKAAETVVGCLTQCVKSSTVSRKMNLQTAVNILLKVNSKLNGVNHVLANTPLILQRPVMIMGADVTHPPPDSQNIPSVAAVTASHDPKAFKYNICWRLQDPRLEIIGDLKDIVLEQLKFFYKQTHCKPEAILFFRDGVSEGQFAEVKMKEVEAIKHACKQVQQEGYEPKITFLVVQKRHHTRLFPTNPRDSEDRNNNVPAGTCVDTDITHPFMQDFYLVSHASIQGVAKPTKYCTLHDDNGMDNDQIEQLTYYLCHMFTRCNRSVSYPAPTYYAHLAAARAKVYIENDTINLDNLPQVFKNYQIKDNIQKGNPMFFV